MGQQRRAARLTHRPRRVGQGGGNLQHQAARQGPHGGALQWTHGGCCSELRDGSLQAGARVVHARLPPLCRRAVRRQRRRQRVIKAWLTACGGSSG